MYLLRRKMYNMFTYTILYSDSEKNLKILEQLYDNEGLKTVLLNQGLIFGKNQIKHELKLYQNCFEVKHLPYYNFVECPTYISTHDIQKDMIICLIDIPFYMPLRINIFIDKVFKHELVTKMLSAINHLKPDMVKIFLKGFLEIEVVKNKLLQWVHALFYYTTVFESFNDNIIHDLDRLKIYIEMYYDVITNKETTHVKKYSCPLINSCKKENQLNMLRRQKQQWKANTELVTVHFQYKEFSSTFTVLVSLINIYKGDRLFHTVDDKEEVKLKNKLISKWPFIIQIEEEIFIPKQLWNVPVLIDGEKYNLFDRFIERINSGDSISQCTFQIDKLTKRYYEVIDMNELEKKYNIVQCKRVGNKIKVINYLKFNLL